MSDTESILPEILIDDTADEYVETDDEPGTPSPKTRPPANEIFYQDEEPPEDEPAPPAVEPTFNYVKPAKPKRQVSEKQRQHLATIRTKALETRKANAKAKRGSKLKAQPAPAPTPAPAPAPTPAPARFKDLGPVQLHDAAAYSHTESPNQVPVNCGLIVLSHSLSSLGVLDQLTP